MKIIDVYSTQPLRNKSDANGSENFTEIMSYQSTPTGVEEQDSTYELLRYIHLKIEERFKDYRKAFRAIDKNFDGGLSFKEFMIAIENLGIRFSFKDHRRVFNFVDFDNDGEIDFNKFCLLNTDKVKLKHWQKL